MNLALTYDELSLPHRPGMQRPKSFSGLTCEMYEEVCRRTDFIGLLSPDLRWLQASAKWQMILVILLPLTLPQAHHGPNHWALCKDCCPDISASLCSSIRPQGCPPCPSGWCGRGICYSSVAQWCLTLCDLMDYSMPGFPVLHYLPEFAQTHVLWVRDGLNHL